MNAIYNVVSPFQPTGNSSSDGRMKQKPLVNLTKDVLQLIPWVHRRNFKQSLINGSIHRGH